MKLKLISDTEYIINIPDDELFVNSEKLAQFLGYKTIKNIPSTELPPPIDGANHRWLLPVIIDWARNRSIYVK